MSLHPAIIQLDNFRKKYKCRVEVIPNHFLANESDFPALTITLNDSSFSYFVDDEYHDLQLNNQLLSICIALRALESYTHANDYLIWCTQHGLPASNDQVRQHHIEMRSIFEQIEGIVGKIDSYISDMDFELNAGAAQILRESHRPNVKK